MKSVFFILLILTISFASKGQSYSVKYYPIMKYEHFTLNGDKIGDKRHGEWIEVSDKGIVYTESFYNMGIPIDNWKLFYPDGGLRKETQFDSLGSAKILIRYNRNKLKYFEIIPDVEINIECLNSINDFDQDLFIKESNGLGPANPPSGQDFKIFMPPPIKMSGLTPIIKVLSKFDFEGKCLIYYESGNLASKTIISPTRAIEQWKYYYSNGKLKSKDIYVNDELIKTIKYNKDGSIKKEKNR